MKQKLRGQHAEHEAKQGEYEIRQGLAEQDLFAAHRRDQERFEGAALPFARHDHGRQQAADQRHHQHHEARHQKVAAVVGLVEPQARLQR